MPKGVKRPSEREALALSSAEKVEQLTKKESKAKTRGRRLQVRFVNAVLAVPAHTTCTGPNRLGLGSHSARFLLSPLGTSSSSRDLEGTARLVQFLCGRERALSHIVALALERNVRPCLP